MLATNAAPTGHNRFESLKPASLSKSEKSAVVALALSVLSQRFRPGRVFRSPGDFGDFLRLKLSGRRNEVFGVIFLDTRHRLIGIAELFNGTVDGATVHVRVVLQKALDRNAAAVAVFHNHPSGVAEPSESDRVLTDRLARALDLVDVRLIDHFVVTDGEVVSFAERGWV